MLSAFFITGTDTGVGKTLISTALLHAANDRGLSTAAFKPIASGCEQTPEGLRNDDALRLQQAINRPLHYDQINPVALKAAIAPHVAAASSPHHNITIDKLVDLSRCVLNSSTDFAIVEGAGGWRVPINHRETLADLAKVLKLPVIMVVGMRLGCLNHACLTAEAIERDGLTLAGWVSNRIDPTMEACDASLTTLEQSLSAPCLGHIPFLTNPRGIDIRHRVDMDKLRVQHAVYK